MTSRWERLLDSKPVPVVDHVLAEVAKLFAQDLGRWPLDVVEFESPPANIAPLLRAEAPRPTRSMWGEAFRLARWDLERAHDAFDDYVRNQRWRERELSDELKPLLLFLERFIVEQLLAFREATHGRITRAQLLTLLEATRRHVEQSSVGPA